MRDPRILESAFETAIEANLLQNGYLSITSDCCDRDNMIVPEIVFTFISQNSVSIMGNAEDTLWWRDGRAFMM